LLWSLLMVSASCGSPTVFPVFAHTRVCADAGFVAAVFLGCCVVWLAGCSRSHACCLGGQHHRAEKSGWLFFGVDVVAVCGRVCSSFAGGFRVVLGGRCFGEISAVLVVFANRVGLSYGARFRGVHKHGSSLGDCWSLRPAAPCGVVCAR
jgi:hypothetical protein